MSRRPEPSYELRPNKAVDRDVFIDLLLHLRGTLPLHNFHYVGMGGPHLEDFRLVMNRVGMRRLLSVERDPATYRRQQMNCPPFVDTVPGDIDEVLRDMKFNSDGYVIWLDYTNPPSQQSLEGVSELVQELPVGSIVKVTYNCMLPCQQRPNSGRSFAMEVKAAADRLLGRFCPAAFEVRTLASKRGYAHLIKSSIALALSDGAHHGDTTGQLVTSAVYQDGSTMMTCTVIVVEKEDPDRFGALLRNWDYHDFDWTAPPFLIDIPTLSPIERSIFDYLADEATRAEVVPGDAASRESHAQAHDGEAPPPSSPAAGAAPDSNRASGDSSDSGKPLDWITNLQMALRSGGAEFRPRGNLAEGNEVLESFIRFHRLFPRYARLHD